MNRQKIETYLKAGDNQKIKLIRWNEISKHIKQIV